MENNFKNNLAYLVKMQNLSQDEFGLCFGLKKGIVNQYLLGKSFPKMETIQKIALAYGFTIDGLVKADIEQNFKVKNIVPELNLERLSLPEQVIFKDVIEKNEGPKEVLADKIEIIELQRSKIATLEEKLQQCQDEKKLLENNKLNV